MMKVKESAEDYLETILVLKERLGQVRSIDIANDMGYSKPSISVAMKRLRENGWQVVNLDSTIVAQAPKLAPYRETMRRNLAEALGIDVSRVSVKATTEERLGFTGDGSGMAAQAIALIEREYPRLTRADALSGGPDRR